jgi:hypothetical protein
MPSSVDTTVLIFVCVILNLVNPLFLLDVMNLICYNCNKEKTPIVSKEWILFVVSVGREK